MSEKKHIDRLFQEGFKDFEATPSDAVWKNIEANLNKKKKKRVIPIWWRYAGVAALLLLFLAIGGVLLNNPDATTPSIQVVETEDAQPNETESSNSSVISNSNEGSDLNEQTSNPLKNSSTFKQQNTNSIAENSTSKESSEREILKNESEKNLDQNKNVIAQNEKGAVTDKLQNTINNNIASVEKQNNNDKSVVENKSSKDHTNNSAIAQTKTELNSVENEEIANNEKEESLTIEEALEEKKELLEDNKRTNRWAVVPNAAPVYFNSLGQGSSIDPQFNNNSKSGEVNMSYGISASYALNDKISIRSGIHKVNLGYNTNDVIIYQTAGVSTQSSLPNVRESSSINAASDNVAIASGSNFNTVALALNSTNTTLNQAFGYIEVPLEVQYALSNKKFGVNVIGGFSSFFLNNNKIYSEAENGNRIFLGEANNLNKVSYSANFGLGFNYHISKRLDLNLEPMFKYQFNTFNNTSGNFTPFFIGVYSGIAIKF